MGAELPSSALIPTAQRQPRVDFLSSDTAAKSILRIAVQCLIVSVFRQTQPLDA